MGYEVDFKIRIFDGKRNNISESIDIEEEFPDSFGLEECNGWITGTGNWRKRNEEIQAYTEKNPTYYLYLEGRGEEDDDIFRVLAHNGKIEEEYADIRFPELPANFSSLDLDVEPGGPDPVMAKAILKLEEFHEGICACAIEPGKEYCCSLDEEIFTKLPVEYRKLINR